MAIVGWIKLGSQGLEVSAKGLGCKDLNAPGKPEPDMVALVHYVESGVTFLDTFDFYGQNANEILLGNALKGDVGEIVEFASKFGLTFANRKVDIRGDPTYVRAACEAA